MVALVSYRFGSNILYNSLLTIDMIDMYIVRGYHLFMIIPCHNHSHRNRGHNINKVIIDDEVDVGR